MMGWTAAAGSALGHDVRAVRKEGDAAEALRLALRAEVAAGLVQPLQAGVLLRRVPAALDRPGLGQQHGLKMPSFGFVYAPCTESLIVRAV